tara:strand:+ start:1123 stop:1731 length:609 start_codon:yes stop_codon:yes gene_type:complete
MDLSEFFNLSKVIDIYNRYNLEQKKLSDFMKNQNTVGKESYRSSQGSSCFGNIILLMELLMWLSPKMKLYALETILNPMYDYGNIVNDIRAFLKIGSIPSDGFKAYIGYDDINDLYKIGRSKDPCKRMSFLNINPVLILGDDVGAVLLCEHERVKGEWVLPENIDVQKIYEKYIDMSLYYSDIDDDVELESVLLRYRCWSCT